MASPFSKRDPLSDSALLNLQDDTLSVKAAEKVRILIGKAYPEIPDPGRLPLGVINRLLVELRISLFGDRFNFLDTCPACNEPVEFSLPSVEFLPGNGATNDNAETGLVESGEWKIHYRTLRLEDLEHVEGLALPSDQEAGKALLGRAIQSVTHKGKPMESDSLDSDLWETLSTGLSETDPWSVIEFELHCPGCRHSWDSAFEPALFLQQEIDSRARRILAEVHELASRYGWTESEILRLSPIRRARYLQLVRDDSLGTGMPQDGSIGHTMS